MAAGCSDQEIADRLFVSLTTVRTHLTAVLRKLGCARRGQVAHRLGPGGGA